MAVREQDDVTTRIADALRARFPRAEDVRVYVAPSGRIHVRVVDREFNPLTEVEKQDLIWPVLAAAIDEPDLGRVSLALAYGTDESYDLDTI